jgi:PAS domain S-box-containing protein
VGKISLDLVYQQLGEATLAEARVQEAQPRTLAEIEQRAIELALADSGGNVALAAQKLGIGRSTLYTYLRKRQNRIGFNGTSNVAEVVLRDRRIVSVSDKACELIGYSRKELLGQTSEVFSNLSDAARKAIYLKWKEQGSVTGVYALRHRKGVPIEVMFETTTLPNGDCRCLWLPIRENGKGS